MDPVLEFVNLSVSFPDGDSQRLILDSIELAVQPGEVVGLVGEAGSGKSTLLNAVTGLLPPAAQINGVIRIDGVETTQLSEAEVRTMRAEYLGFVASGGRARLNPMARVGKQIENILREAGYEARKARERTIEVLSIVGIADPERRFRSYPHELSGGMAQRVVIAMALCRTPKLLLADEPTNGLDVTIQADILDMLSELIDESRASALISTSDFGIVAEHCDRVCVLERGRIVESSSTVDFFKAPQSPYSAELLSLARGATADLR